MPLGGAAIIGGSSLLGGIIGATSSSADRDAASAARQQALQAFLAVNVPDPAQQKVILQRYQSTGQLTPELEKAFNQSQTALNNVQLDPTTRTAQISALQKMQQIGNANGLDAQAQAANQQTINQLDANTKGQRDAILQSYAQRGQGGSGAALQAQLLAGQQDANTASSQGMQASAAAQQRALQAMANSATLAGQVNTSDYNQAAAKANATDAINRFNTANSQSVSNANTGISNSAQAANLAASQALSNANTGIANQQETQNVGTLQQNYDNRLRQAAGEAGQYGQVATQNTANANATAAQWSGIGQAVAQGAAAYGQYANNKKNAAADPNAAMTLSDNSDSQNTDNKEDA